MTEPSVELRSFLDWYEVHKDSGGNYSLTQDLILNTGTADVPILLDGAGEINIYCNQYNMVIQSDVVIDNKNLCIYSKNQSGSAITLGSELEAENPKLTLKNGAISVNAKIGLSILSGELICPQEESRFRIYAWGDAATALEVVPSDITLRNLDLGAFGTGEIVVINSKSELNIQNCVVMAEGEEPESGAVIGIQSQGAVRLSGTTVTAQGNAAQSVICMSGMDQIKADEECSFLPELEIPSDRDAKYRVTQIQNPAAVNVPIGTSGDILWLPNVLECQMAYMDGSTDSIVEQSIEVNWDIADLDNRLKSEGECVISGTFSEEQLAEEHIWAPQSMQPQMKIRVIPSTAMNRIWFSKIEPNHAPPFVEIYMQKPYEADSLVIEYSKDGDHWEQGYCIRTKDGVQDSNVLLHDEAQAPTLTIPVFVSEIVSSTRIRAVVTGGPFSGTWESVFLDPENLFTPPGEDGKGGDRGGQTISGKESAAAQETDENGIEVFSPDDLTKPDMEEDTAGQAVVKGEGTETIKRKDIHDFSAGDEKGETDNSETDDSKKTNQKEQSRYRNNSSFGIVLVCIFGMVFVIRKSVKKMFH